MSVESAEPELSRKQHVLRCLNLFAALSLGLGGSFPSNPPSCHLTCQAGEEGRVGQCLCVKDKESI